MGLPLVAMNALGRWLPGRSIFSSFGSGLVNKGGTAETVMIEHGEAFEGVGRRGS